MTRINDLPGASTNFRVNVGVGSFSKKLSSATRVGDLRHLGDNKDSIVKVLKKNEAAIRRGSFSAVRRASAWNEIKKLEGRALTKTDAKQIKNLLKHLSEGKRLEDNKPKIKIQRQLAKDDSFEKERKGEEKKDDKKINRQLDVSTKRLSRPGFANQEADNQDSSFSNKLLERRFKNKEETRASRRLEKVHNNQTAGQTQPQNISFGNQPVSNQGVTASDRIKKNDPGRERGIEPGRLQINKSGPGPGPGSSSSNSISPTTPFQNL